MLQLLYPLLVIASGTLGISNVGGAEESSVSSTPHELDWWQSMVLYQIYPRSFMDSDGDGIGDLRGIISKLSHLSSSGIKATWLSPIFQSPMIDFGYDISNFTAIHEEYGTMEDFEDLVAEAKRLDIKLILDFVPNHSSDQCEWFLKSAAREPGYEDFYVWADGRHDEDGERQPPNNWKSVFYGSAWTWHPEREQYYLHQFTAAQPDLNYRNPSVIKAMQEVLLFWLDKGVSGFRVDAVNHLFEVEDLRDEPETGSVKDSNSYEFLHHYYTKDLPEVYDIIYSWRDLLDKYKEEHNDGLTRIMMTEAYANVTCLMNFYEDDTGAHKGSHIPFNFMMITSLFKTSDARDFVFTFQRWMTYMPVGGTANWVIGNHDVPRVASRFGKEMVDPMNILLMTLPGVAVTYNGDEIGMEDFRDIAWEDTKDPPALAVGPEKYKEVSRDPVRTPFQWDGTKNAGFSTASKTWLPVNPNFKTVNLAMQMKAEKSHYKLYKKLIELKRQPTLAKGEFYPMALSRKTFAFKRELKGHPTFITVINVTPWEDLVDLRPLMGDSPKELTIVAAGTESTYTEGKELDAFDNFRLQGHEGIVLSMA
ncbi:maltase 2-like isoform X2 [Eupeodes corollae]|uniref:maltase 2-like isoform X2 n=1 Tax=Eupeodes corollae TaxID=290404 RepID=UPI00248FA601|nr:maltase 2-like isoform X2 [Eupeodes corollae]